MAVTIACPPLDDSPAPRADAVRPAPSSDPAPSFAGPGRVFLGVSLAEVLERRRALGADLERLGRGVDAGMREFRDALVGFGYEAEPDPRSCPSPAALAAVLDAGRSEVMARLGAPSCLRLDPFRAGWRARALGTALEVRAEVFAPSCSLPPPGRSGTVQRMSYPLWRISLHDAVPVECWTVCVEGDLYTCRARLVRLEASAILSLGDEVEIESFAGELEAFAGRLARRNLSACVGPG